MPRERSVTMAGAICDLQNLSDAGLAASMRLQLRSDIIAGQRVPPGQQMVIEAIARILERSQHKTLGESQRELERKTSRWDEAEPAF